MNSDRTPASDLWRHTLAQIPSILGRIIYLASLRDPLTGLYHHFGLAQKFDPDQASQTLRDSHVQTFGKWLCLTLEQQKNDLELYLSQLDAEPAHIIRNWARLCPFASWVPADTRQIERDLFLTDLAALLELLKHEYAVASPDPNA